MSVAETLLQALRLLRAHPLRSALTLFGLVWGTAAVIFLASWGRGVEKMNEASFERLGRNMISFWAGRVSEDFSPAADRRWLWFDREDVAALRERARRSELVAAESRTWLPVSFRGRALNLEVRGVEPEGIEIRGVAVADGRRISHSDLDHRRRVAMIGHRARRRLLGPEGRVGDWIRVDGRPFQLVAIHDRVGTQLARDGAELDDQLWIPITTHVGLWPNPWTDDERVDRVLVRFPERDDLDAAEREARTLLALRLGVATDDEEAVPAFSPTRMLQTVPVDEQNAVNFLIAATTILVGGVGILSMMLDSVRERRTEIGIRLAVGATRRDVLAQFLFETLALVAIGGGLGVALGVLGSLALGSAALRGLVPPALADLIPIPVLETAPLVHSVLILGAVGLFASLVPAWRAARVDPAVTLRSE